MRGFGILWSRVLGSSIWVNGTKETRLVWVTMLMMKDKAGVVRGSVVGLADRAKVSVGECREALKVLMTADGEATGEVEGGRRVREVAGGWEIVGWEVYRSSSEKQRAYWRRKKGVQVVGVEVGGKVMKETKVGNRGLGGGGYEEGDGDKYEAERGAMERLEGGL